MKNKLRELAAEVDKIKDEMEEPSFRLGVKHLEKLVRWKTQKGDEKLPSKKRRTSSRGGTPSKGGSRSTSVRIILVMRVMVTARRTTMTCARPAWINHLVNQLVSILFFCLFLLFVVWFLPQRASTTGPGEGSGITNPLVSTPG